MGNGASFESAPGVASQEILEAYATNPELWETIIDQCRKHHTLQLQHAKEKKEGSSDLVSETNGTKAETGEVEMLSVSFSHQLCKEINILRSDPVSYAAMLQPLHDSFTDDLIFTTKGGLRIKTKEGKKLVADTMEWLKQQSPQPCMESSELLEKAAIYQTEDMRKNLLMGHESSYGFSSKERIELYAMWTGKIGENIDYFHDELEHEGLSAKKQDETGVLSMVEAARKVVVDLLVDDGVPTRGHRHNLMDAGFKMVGSSIGPHNRYKYVCVMVFAGGVVDKKWLLTEDLNVSFKTPKDVDTFEKADSIFLSIPYQGDLREQIKIELAKGNHEVTINYMNTRKEAEITFAEIDGHTIRSRIKTIKW